MEKLEILVAPEKSNFVKTKPLRPARVPQGGRRLFELVVHHQVMVCEGGRCASAAGPSPGRGRRTKKNQTPSSWQIPAPLGRTSQYGNPTQANGGPGGRSGAPSLPRLPSYREAVAAFVWALAG